MGHQHFLSVMSKWQLTSYQVDPVYWGWLYVFVPVRTPPPPPAADSCSRDNFWTILWISFIFGTIVDPDLLRFWSILVVTLTLTFSKSNMEFAISQPKWSDCHEMKSKYIDWTLRLKCDHRVWPWPWPWPRIFKIRYGIYYTSAKNGLICHGTISKHIDWTPQGLKFDQLVWPWPWHWPLNFQGQMWHWPLATHMALTKDFHGKFFK